MILDQTTRYPNYDVMNEQLAWDDHTRSIVTARLHRTQPLCVFLTTMEEETLRSWCALLVDDNRGELIQYIIAHIDETLSSAKGEGQRQPHTPPAPILVRRGLHAVNASSRMADSLSFFHLEEGRQRQLMMDIAAGTLAGGEAWEGVPQRAFFQKLLSLTVEAYYSHPTVWSEIGHGGPAYPRGYVRTAIGQLDPWEASER